MDKQGIYNNMIISDLEWKHIKSESEKIKFGEIKLIFANDGKRVDIIISNRKILVNKK